jgi:chorismate synthase
MNTLGNHFRLQIFGESHGPSVGIMVDGCPAGLPLNVSDFTADLDRRRGGAQKGTTARREPDSPLIQSGIFNGYTTGAPVVIAFENKDVSSSEYEAHRAIPRPGHADFTAAVKAGGYQDYRGSGHYSGRLTVALVAAGVLAKKILAITSEGKVTVSSQILEVGGENDIPAGLEKAMAANDSVGGIVECRVSGLPAGLGEPFFDSVESLISHAVFSIPAIRGIEFGTGFPAARMFGSVHNDALENAAGKTITNHAGGITGGLTNGNEIVFRVAVKPASSTPHPQESFNQQTGEMETFVVAGRHDTCIALRVPVVLEAVTACVLTDLMMVAGHIPSVFNPKKISGS